MCSGEGGLGDDKCLGLPRTEGFPRHGTFWAKTTEILGNLGHVGHSRYRLWSLIPVVCFSDDYCRGLTDSSSSAVLCCLPYVLGRQNPSAHLPGSCA